MEGMELAEDGAPGSQADVRVRDTPTLHFKTLVSSFNAFVKFKGASKKLTLVNKMDLNKKTNKQTTAKGARPEDQVSTVELRTFSRILDLVRQELKKAHHFQVL